VRDEIRLREATEIVPDNFVAADRWRSAMDHPPAAKMARYPAELSLEALEAKALPCGPYFEPKPGKTGPAVFCSY
jgi:hypothetical protein